MVDKFKDPSDLNTLLSLAVGDFILCWDIDEAGDEKLKTITKDDFVSQINSDLISDSTDNSLARYNGTDKVQGSGISVDDSDNVTGINSLEAEDITIPTGDITLTLGNIIVSAGNITIPNGTITADEFVSNSDAVLKTASGDDYISVSNADGSLSFYSGGNQILSISSNGVLTLKDSGGSTILSIDTNLSLNAGSINSNSTSITASQTNLDVSNVNFVIVDTSSGDVTLNGLQGGVDGQHLFVFKTTLANNLTIGNNDGVGTQDIYCTSDADLVLAQYGGVVLACNGSDWYVVESSTGTGGASVESDIYTDILQDSKYEFLTFDDFKNEDLTDAGNTTATFDLNNSKYTFTAAQKVQSDNLFDSTSGVSVVTEALIEVMYSDSGTPTIEATADGTNWETVTAGEIHEFTNTGTTLKLRFTGGGTGEVTSWAIFYGIDQQVITTIVTNHKMTTYYYEGSAQDEDIIIDGIYFPSSVGISAITINARVAPTDADLTVDIIKGGSEQTKIATLTDASVYEKTTFTSHAQFGTTDRFGLKIKSIGSTEAGQGLNVTIHYYDR